MFEVLIAWWYVAPCSLEMMEATLPLKRLERSTRIHGVTSENTAIGIELRDQVRAMLEH
jgi:hypothetical protein